MLQHLLPSSRRAALRTSSSSSLSSSSLLSATTAAAFLVNFAVLRGVNTYTTSSSRSIATSSTAVLSQMANSNAADDPFRPQAHKYIKFRPSYPDELVSWLVDACEGRELAVDVGCGSGQMTRLLAPHFKKVIGVDRSAAQLSQTSAFGSSPTSSATSAFSAHAAIDTGDADSCTDGDSNSGGGMHPKANTIFATTTATVTDAIAATAPAPPDPFRNVEYKVADATDLSAEAVAVDDVTVDCVTAAQMAHWLIKKPGGMEAFTGQVKRMLKPGTGRFFIAGYTICDPVHAVVAEEMSALYQATIKDDRWPFLCAREALEVGMVGVDFPYMRVAEHRWFRVVSRITLWSFLQYIDTWSAFADRHKPQVNANDGNGTPITTPQRDLLTDEVAELRAKILKRAPELHDDAEVDIVFPFFALQLENEDGK